MRREARKPRPRWVPIKDVVGRGRGRDVCALKFLSVLFFLWSYETSVLYEDVRRMIFLLHAMHEPADAAW